MITTFSTAVITPFENPLSQTQLLPLYPDIIELMAEYEEYDALEYTWTRWHDVTGSEIRSDYSTYVELKNEFAVANSKHWVKIKKENN